MFQLLFRLFLLFAILILSALTSTIAHDVILNIFGYQIPSDFSDTGSWADWSLAFVTTSLFWSGIIFGTFGEKIDYVFVALTILFAAWEYIYSSNITPQMYLGLIGVAVIGNLIGFCLKLARQKWFTRPI
jgi:hypothetical protein